VRYVCKCNAPATAQAEADPGFANGGGLWLARRARAYNGGLTAELLVGVRGLRSLKLKIFGAEAGIFHIQTGD
jgi:hypothetical protein